MRYFLLYFSVYEALKQHTSGSDFNVTLSKSVNFGSLLPSYNFNEAFFGLIPLSKKFLRLQVFTAVAN